MAKVQSERAKRIREAKAKRLANVCIKHGAKVSTSALMYRCGCATN